MNKECTVDCRMCKRFCEKYMLDKVCDFKISYSESVRDCSLILNFGIKNTKGLMDWLEKNHLKHYVFLKLLGEL